LAKAKSQRAGRLGSFDLRQGRPANQLLRLLPRGAMEALLPALELVEAGPGETLFEPGDDVTHAHFPLGATVVAFILPMRDGRTIEAATIGREGCAGGVVSLGLKPAFARGTVQLLGPPSRLSIPKLEEAKRPSTQMHDDLAC